MTLWVLDTDHLSLLERGNPKIQGRLGQVDSNSVVITIVTAEEKVKGRLTVINSLSGIERVGRLAVAYQALQSTIKNLQILPILPFSELARDRYRELLEQMVSGRYEGNYIYPGMSGKRDCYEAFTKMVNGDFPIVCKNCY